MDVILPYLLFAVTTGLVSLYELINPVLRELAVTDPDNVVLQNKTISYITFTLMGILCAPILFVPCVFPSIGERFRSALVIALQD